MTQWWRFYSDAIFDAKLLRLSDAMFRAWTTLLCIAAKHDGVLPAASDIALTLRMKPTKVAEWITALHVAGLIDKTETGFAPHNWNGRQYKSDVSTTRVKRFRNANRNVSSAVSETAPETEAETETEPEKKKETRASALADDWPSDFFERFYKGFPKRIEPQAVRKKLETLRKSRSVTFAELMAGAKRYSDSVSGTEPQYIKAPVAWLNAGRWADEIPTGGSNANRTANSRASGQSAFVAAATRRAREFTGPDAMAGTTDPLGHASGSGIDSGGAPGFAGPLRGTGNGAGGIELDGGRVIEGEVGPRDEARGWFGDGSDVGFSGRRSA